MYGALNLKTEAKIPNQVRDDKKIKITIMGSSPALSTGRQTQDRVFRYDLNK